MSTREIKPVDMQMIIEFLRENLHIDVDTTSEYTGEMSGTGEMYRQCHTIKLVLNGEVISEAGL